MESNGGLLSGNRHGTLLAWLTVFTLGSVVITLIGEAFKTHLIWYMRFADFVDLLVVAPLYIVSLISFYAYFEARKGPRWLLRVLFALAILLLYGHAMHVTANAVNTFSTEIRDYQALLPEDMYALLYFLDETLSHLIIFISRYGLFACLLGLQITYTAPTSATSRFWPGMIVGLLFGIWEAVVFIEGQKVLLGLVLVIALGVLWGWLWRRSSTSFMGFLRTGPVTDFVAGLLPGVLIGFGVYRLVVGSFIEPSDLGV